MLCCVMLWKDKCSIVSGFLKASDNAECKISDERRRPVKVDFTKAKYTTYKFKMQFRGRSKDSDWPSGGRSKGGRKIHGPMITKCVFLFWCILGPEREGRCSRSPKWNFSGVHPRLLHPPLGQPKGREQCPHRRHQVL
jgi:hypothetical protein